MGFGDVKMLAMIGAFLGVKLVILTFVLSSLIGGVVGVVLIASRRGRDGHRGAVRHDAGGAALVASLRGDEIVRWYLSVYGWCVSAAHPRNCNPLFRIGTLPAHLGNEAVIMACKSLTAATCSEGILLAQLDRRARPRRTARTRAMSTFFEMTAGFTLVELMLAIAIGLLVVGMAVGGVPGMIKTAKADGGLDIVVGGLRAARELSTSDRRNVQLSFGTNTPQGQSRRVSQRHPRRP